jgi:hypothetical protein
MILMVVDAGGGGGDAVKFGFKAAC